MEQSIIDPHSSALAVACAPSASGCLPLPPSPPSSGSFSRSGGEFPAVSVSEGQTGSPCRKARTMSRFPPVATRFALHEPLVPAKLWVFRRE